MRLHSWKDTHVPCYERKGIQWKETKLYGSIAKMLYCCVCEWKSVSCNIFFLSLSSSFRLPAWPLIFVNASSCHASSCMNYMQKPYTSLNHASFGKMLHCVGDVLFENYLHCTQLNSDFRKFSADSLGLNRSTSMK